MLPQLTGLWRHPDFLKLWAGQTISLFGSQITALALPLTAVLTLQATPAQMGTLRATHSASAMLAGLFAGVWADRLRRRPILIGTDLGFAVLAGSIPSALFIWLIRAPEPAPEPAANRRSIWAEIGEGLRFVFGNSTLRPLLEAIATHFLFNGLIYSVFILYASRELKIESALLGVVFAALGLGLLTGALAAERLTRRCGVGPTMIGATFTTAVAALLIPLADGPIPVSAAMLAFAVFLQAFGIQVNGINLVSLRQAMTPAQLQGRMNGAFRFLNSIAVTIGALLAGAFSEVIGLRATLVMGACGLFIPFLRLLFSPARSLQKAINTA
jgi:predicted MFS family arabinose efflux permease